MVFHSFYAAFLGFCILVLLAMTAGVPLGIFCLGLPCGVLRLWGGGLLAMGVAAVVVLLRLGVAAIKKRGEP